MKFRGGRSTLSNGDMGDAHWRDNDLSWRHAYPSRLIKQSIPEKLYELNCRAVTGRLASEIQWAPILGLNLQARWKFDDP